MILKLCLINYQEQKIWKKLMLRTLLKAITSKKKKLKEIHQIPFKQYKIEILKRVKYLSIN